MAQFTQRTGFIYSNANSEALRMSQKDQNGVTVVQLGNVYNILEKMYHQYENELKKMNDFYQKEQQKRA